MNELREQLEADVDEFIKAAGITNEFSKKDLVKELLNKYKTKENYDNVKSLYPFISNEDQ